jgi:hypothetical protein
LGMQYCSKCQRRKVVDYHVEPEEAWKLVVLNRWPIGKLCASCFDAEAEKAKVRYSFVNVTAQLVDALRGRLEGVERLLAAG